MRAADPRDAGDLVLPRVLEIDGIRRNAIAVRLKEPVLSHPCPRGVAQIDAIRVVVTKLGFMADDDNRHVVFPAVPEKRVDTLNHLGLPKALSVHLPLQLLPRQLAVRKQPDRVADRLLSASEVSPDEPLLTRGREKYGIVGDNRIVEIQAYAQLAAHFFADMLCRLSASARSALAQFQRKRCAGALSRVESIELRSNGRWATLRITRP